MPYLVLIIWVIPWFSRVCNLFYIPLNLLRARYTYNDFDLHGPLESDVPPVSAATGCCVVYGVMAVARDVGSVAVHESRLKVVRLVLRTIVLESGAQGQVLPCEVVGVSLVLNRDLPAAGAGCDATKRATTA